MVDVRVDLCCGDAGVSEQFLHLSQVGTTGEQVCGETVPQRVRTNLAGDADACGVLFDELPNAFPAQRTAAWRENQPLASGRFACR